jgi:hypothetical protein
MKGKSVTFRPRADLRERLERLCIATERPMTYWLEKSVEAHLPALEEKYAEELLKLGPRPPGSKTYPTARPSHYEMNEKKKKKTG